MSTMPDAMTTSPEAPTTARRPTPLALASKALRWRQTGILAALFLMIIAFGIAEPSYLSARNLVTIIQQSAVTGIVAIGLTFVLITGGIDLSFGSIVGLAAAVLGVSLASGIPILVAVVLAVIVGGVAGLLNGVLITGLKITPLIITLGTLSIYAGLALLITGGATIFSLPPEFLDTMNMTIVGVPLSVVILFAVLAVSGFLLRQTTFGEYLIAIGGNAEVARLAGIRVGRYVAGAYALLGLLAGIAALVTVGRLGSADPQVGAGLLLPAIAATVIGGTKLSGGEGSVAGAVIGATFISALQAGLTILVITAFVQQLAIGTVIILAVTFDNVQRGELTLFRRSSATRKPPPADEQEVESPRR